MRIYVLVKPRRLKLCQGLIFTSSMYSTSGSGVVWVPWWNQRLVGIFTLHLQIGILIRWHRLLWLITQILKLEVLQFVNFAHWWCYSIVFWASWWNQGLVGVFTVHLGTVIHHLWLIAHLLMKLKVLQIVNFVQWWWNRVCPRWNGRYACPTAATTCSWLLIFPGCLVASCLKCLFRFLAWLWVISSYCDSTSLIRIANWTPACGL